MLEMDCSEGRPVRRKRRVKGEPTNMLWNEYQEQERRRRIQLIQELIPIGLMAVAEELSREVAQLLDEDSRAPSEAQRGLRRHGSNPGTVRLGDQILPIRIPRIRGRDGEVSLESYELLHAHPNLGSESVFRKVSSGVSTRKLERTLQPASGAIGASKSSISRKTVVETQKALDEIQKRSLEGFDLISMFIDGTNFANDQMIIALGVDVCGRKKVLGFTQSATEHHKPVANFLRDLLARKLEISSRILVCVDGSKGIQKAVRMVLGEKAHVQRCHWHKRENVASYLPTDEQESFKKRLQHAFDRPTYSEAEIALRDIEKELKYRNQNAFRSLQEGLDEVLALHRLGVFATIGLSFKTTNCIESLNSQAKAYCRRVRNWTDSSQKQRWLAAALLEAESGFRRVKGYAQLPDLRDALGRCCQTSRY